LAGIYIGLTICDSLAATLASLEFAAECADVFVGLAVVGIELLALFASESFAAVIYDELVVFLFA
jgi:hypothetical protein